MAPPGAVLRRSLALAAGVGLVAGLVAYVGPAEVAAALAGARLEYLLLAFVAYAAFFLLRGIRWTLLLRDAAPGARLANTAGLTAAGWLVSTYVPFKAGDPTRAALLARRERAPLLGVAGSVGLERALDAIGLALAASAALLAASVGAQHHLPPTVGQAILVAWTLPILGLVALVLLARHLPRRDDGSKLVRLAHQVLLAADGLRREPRRLPSLGALTVLVIASQVLVFVFLFRAFEPVAPLLAVAAGVPLFLLSFIISVTPGNLGTYEAAWVAVYTLLGFDPAALVPMAIGVHLTTITIVTLLGGAGALLAHATPRAEQAPAPAVEEQTAWS